jgi:hypothetical protein
MKYDFKLIHGLLLHMQDRRLIFPCSVRYTFYPFTLSSFLTLMFLPLFPTHFPLKYLHSRICIRERRSPTFSDPPSPNGHGNLPFPDHKLSNIYSQDKEVIERSAKDYRTVVESKLIWRRIRYVPLPARCSGHLSSPSLQIVKSPARPGVTLLNRTSGRQR